MIEVDCRKCANCDIFNHRCRKYGSNASIAVEKCASDGFKNYVVFGESANRKGANNE